MDINKIGLMSIIKKGDLLFSLCGIYYVLFMSKLIRLVLKNVGYKKNICRKYKKIIIIFFI